ncbi:putative prenyltransferase, contains 1,4-dihydroxy-2-naphthoate octaprenyltransferase domain protein [Alkalibacterium sp. AK22]|uniref:1,4-dihydroxy-2-naphthoate polyprenyltransferase n=1 Tax=Alkalibacterium sp. AK22 TaxID=1229520 RepID=UPI00044547F0|nr:1,4-dihydroxy-2-naphthoate polyprenyltransferase [Alkalibacterium sp. AK22]EXJ23763.1 putative prenyltransferase, contains 1,4-dihydroxy-2-naphthoate octaprenyltransferase domain protein [Alkalibacterium sp. AK22]
MSPSQFLRFVDIRTKFTSMLPVCLGVALSIYYFEAFNFLNTLVFFIAAAFLDFSTTAINVLIDYRTAATDAFRKEHNIIGIENIPESIVVKYIYGMLTFSFLLGMFLVFRTNLILLLIGLVCFMIGIFYTYGPIPISRMPLGELLSGPPLGFGIILIAVLINAPDQLVLDLSFNQTNFILQGDWYALLVVFFVSLPQVLLISNIVLANNICDLEQDLENKRYTLAHHIGVEKSIRLYNGLTYGAYAALAIPIVFGWLPPVMIAVYATLIFVRRQVKLFNEKQIKAETFVTSVKSFLVFTFSELTLLILAIIWNIFV